MQENNENINISIDDFIKEKRYKDWVNYSLIKSIKLCGKIYKRKAIEFIINKKHSLKNQFQKLMNLSILLQTIGKIILLKNLMNI